MNNMKQLDLIEKIKYFSMYIGNDINVIYKDGTDFDLCGIWNDLLLNGDNEGWHIKDCQLILMPLNNISPNDSKKAFGCDITDFDFEVCKVMTIDNSNKYYDFGLDEIYKLIELSYAIPIKNKYDPFELEWAIKQ